jgi:hypothetical protein
MELREMAAAQAAEIRTGFKKKSEEGCRRNFLQACAAAASPLSGLK